MDSCFFDYNATTPLRAEARAAWLAASEDLWLNPSSPYRAAARVRVHLEAAREQLATLLDVDAARVVFNSGATEANNAVFAHWATTLATAARVAVSPTDHPSVVEAANRYFGERVDWLALDVHGVVDVAALYDLLSQGAVQAVSAMAANNETGLLNDWAGIAAECRSQGIQYHCDAAQWMGKLPLRGLGYCDFVTGCAHKFGGPRSVGFALLPAGAGDFRSLLGGAQESERRAGTEDVAGILAMVAALAAVKSGESLGRDGFVATLSEELPQLELVGLESERLWNTALLILPEFASSRWIRALERRGFLVSAGAACATGKAGPSHVLAAMGIEPDAMRRAVRVSSGWATSEGDWARLGAAFVASYAELRSEVDGSLSTVISI